MHTLLITFLLHCGVVQTLWVIDGQSLYCKWLIPCRLIFVSMTNLLLISSLVSLMSMSLEGVCGLFRTKIFFEKKNSANSEQVMLHAREEYLFQ